jgi:hypothetical protein
MKKWSDCAGCAENAITQTLGVVPDGLTAGEKRSRALK